jgi:hypothetical protein
MLRKEFEKLFVRAQFESASSNGRSATLNMAAVIPNQPTTQTKKPSVKSAATIWPHGARKAKDEVFSKEQPSNTQLAIDTLRALMRTNGWFSITVREDSATWERMSIDRGAV